MIFQKNKLLRFAHCDLAGIGFYPRYVELINEVVEDWCAHGIGVSYRDLHATHGLGLPAVRLEIDFIAPSRCGDVLEFTLAVERLGRSSMTLAVRAYAGGSERLRARLTVVMASLKALHAIPIEGEWRARFARYLVTEPTPAQ